MASCLRRTRTTPDQCRCSRKRGSASHRGLVPGAVGHFHELIERPADQLRERVRRASPQSCDWRRGCRPSSESEKKQVVERIDQVAIAVLGALHHVEKLLHLSDVRRRCGALREIANQAAQLGHFARFGKGVNAPNRQTSTTKRSVSAPCSEEAMGSAARKRERIPPTEPPERPRPGATACSRERRDDRAEARRRSLAQPPPFPGYRE